uniref:Uncharacterized protein n=1 Tax=Termitomyces sp. TaxID=1916073 RepID=A0A386TYM3_9AGAR|nr:hypothetical protein C0992_000018 [Termitomyces sp.]AYE93334.1 hypothetical protein C0992_000019 [Termitomyces sp.]
MIKNIYLFINNKFLPDNNFSEFKEELLNNILEVIKPVLEPVTVDYSNEILANQIYVISVLSFILCIMIVLLIIGLLINIILFVYSDRIKEMFTNKFIRGYINLNKKVIGIEIFVLGGSILYFMYYLSYGLQFLATHRILI